MSTTLFGYNTIYTKGATLATAATVTAGATAITAGSADTNILDGKLTIGRDPADVSTRANGPFKAFAPGMIDMTISFSKEAKTVGAADIAVYLAAFAAGTEIFFAALDGTGTGAQGPAGNWIVVKADRNDSNPDAVKYDIELKPSSFTQYYISA